MDNTAAWIATLAPGVDSAAVEFINELRVRYQLPAVITSGRRDTATQQALLQQGRTTTLQSAHLSGRAFDVDMYGWNRDAVPRWVWDLIGPVGEQHGLRWGGRWKSFVDVGHFEV